MYKLVIALIVFFKFPSDAQSSVSAFMESNLIIVSEDKNGRPLKYELGNSYMILNLSNGDFSLNADLAQIKTGNFKLDSLVKSAGVQRLSFKANIGENMAAFNQQQNDEKNYPLPGVLTVNANSISGIAQFDPINLAEKSESKNYRMDFSLSIDASKIAINGLENIFTKQIVFEIVAGKLNIQH